MPRGDLGDNGLATAATLGQPAGVVVDAQGNLFIADYHNKRIRKVDAKTGIIKTIAGTGTFGFSGDGGPATASNLGLPNGIALDSQGNVYFSEQYNNRIRAIRGPIP